MVLFAELCGDPARALPLSPLVELPHTGSLIIDDIEDNSPERRGGPAAHLRHGLDLAVNAGNLLYFLPSRAVERSGLDAAGRAALYRCYLEEMTRLHVGQGLDILWHRERAAVPSVPEYLEMCRLKTGSLARLAARFGVIAGGGSAAQEEAAGAAAENFGVAFQIVDDVENLSAGVPGKRRGDDIVEGKKSLPVLLFMERSRRQDPARIGRLLELFERAGRAAAGGPGTSRPAAEGDAAVEEACRLIASSGSLEESRRVARDLLEEARGKITSSFPPAEARDQLLALTSGLLAG